MNEKETKPNQIKSFDINVERERSRIINCLDIPFRCEKF